MILDLQSVIFECGYKAVIAIKHTVGIRNISNTSAIFSNIQLF